MRWTTRWWQTSRSSVTRTSCCPSSTGISSYHPPSSLRMLFFHPRSILGIRSFALSLFHSFALQSFARATRAIRSHGSLQKEWREQNERLALFTFSNTRAIRSFYSFYEWAFLKRKLKTGFLSHFLALLRVGNSHFRSLHCLALCSFTLLLLFLLLIALLLLSLFHSRRSFKNSEKSDSIF